MKRTFVLMLVLTLVLALTLPAAAFAKRGGVPANGNSKGRPAVEAADDPVVGDELVPGPGEAKGKDKEKKKDAVEPDEDVDGVESDEEVDGIDAEVDVESPEVEEPEKLTGIANALSRLQRNLARKQAAFEAGTAKGLPAGLQATIAKFMSWLGIDPDAEAEDTDDASDETSGTVEPDPIDEDVPEDEPEAPEDIVDTP